MLNVYELYKIEETRKERFAKVQLIMEDWLSNMIKQAFRNDGCANLTTDANKFQWEIWDSFHTNVILLITLRYKNILIEQLKQLCQ